MYPFIIHSFRSTLIVLSIVSSLSVSGQSNRVEKDEYGEIKIPSSANYGLNGARAMKYSNKGTAALSDFPEFVKALGIVKLAALEVNTANGEIKEEKAIRINRACGSIIKGGHANAFQFGLYNGSQGYFANATINEVLANLAIEMSGSRKGNYKVVDPLLDINLNQNYQSVYQTALNLTVVSQNETLLKELELLEKAMNSFSTQVSKNGNTSSTAPLALQAVQSNFEKSKDSLGFHIANLQIQISNLKFHTENGSSNLKEMSKTEFSNQFSTALLTATGMNLSFQNPDSKLENHFKYNMAYMDALGETNNYLMASCKLFQVLDSRDSQEDPYSFSTINRDNEGPKWGNIIPGMVIENCIQIDGRRLAIHKNIASKKMKSVYDVNQVGLGIMVSQKELIKAVKMLRKNYLD